MTAILRGSDSAAAAPEDDPTRWAMFWDHPHAVALLTAEQTRLVANALRQLSEGVLVMDRSLHTTSINHAFATMVGHSAALAAGMSLDRYFAASYRIRYMQRILAALDRKRGWKGKLICRRGDGSEFPAFVTVEAVSGERIDDAQFVAVIRDLSAEQDYQRRLTHSRPPLPGPPLAGRLRAGEGRPVRPQ